MDKEKCVRCRNERHFWACNVSVKYFKYHGGYESQLCIKIDAAIVDRSRFKGIKSIANISSSNLNLLALLASMSSYKGMETTDNSILKKDRLCERVTYVTKSDSRRTMSRGKMQISPNTKKFKASRE